MAFYRQQMNFAVICYHKLPGTVKQQSFKYSIFKIYLFIFYTNKDLGLLYRMASFAYNSFTNGSQRHLNLGLIRKQIYKLTSNACLQFLWSKKYCSHPFTTRSPSSCMCTCQRCGKVKGLRAFRSQLHF